MVGDKVFIKLFKEQVEIDIPAGIKEKDKLTIQGKGYIGSTGVRGDLDLTVSVKPPKIISERERKIYEQLLRVEKQQSKEK